MPATVRERRDRDLPALARVLVRVHDVDGYPVEGVADPTAWLRSPVELRSWTALVDGAPVGQITLNAATEQDDAARVWTEHTGGNSADLAIPARLFVDPDHRRSGIARRLMTTALEHATSLNRFVAFDVMDKDTAAIELYERLGATRIASVVHDHSDGQAEPAAVYVWPTRRA